MLRYACEFGKSHDLPTIKVRNANGFVETQAIKDLKRDATAFTRKRVAVSVHCRLNATQGRQFKKLRRLNDGTKVDSITRGKYIMMLTVYTQEQRDRFLRAMLRGGKRIWESRADEDCVRSLESRCITLKDRISISNPMSLVSVMEALHTAIKGTRTTSFILDKLDHSCLDNGCDARIEYSENQTIRSMIQCWAIRLLLQLMIIRDNEELKLITAFLTSDITSTIDFRATIQAHKNDHALPYTNKACMVTLPNR